MRLSARSRVAKIGARWTWPDPTHFDHLREELFALLATAAVIGVVAHSFWCEFAGD